MFWITFAECGFQPAIHAGRVARSQAGLAMTPRSHSIGRSRVMRAGGNEVRFDVYRLEAEFPLGRGLSLHEDASRFDVLTPNP